MEPEVEQRRQKQPDLATQLLNRLRKFKGKKPLVVATSTSSVELGKKIARELGGDFHQVLVKKLTDPSDSMKVVGAVTEWAGVFIAPQAIERGVNYQALEEKILHDIEVMQVYRKTHPMHAEPEKRAMIFVDSGSRTGYRLAAVLQCVKTFIPKISVIVAPEMTHRAFALVNNLVDDVIALKVV